MNAIVVLTKGYDNKKDYKMLVNRNNSIYEKFYSKLNDREKFHNIVYHEGNITDVHQRYIQSKTPGLPIFFIAILFRDQAYPEKNFVCHATEASNNFSNGYKNMCQFWTIDFLKYLKNFEYIIRIDEDCIINKIPKNILEIYKEKNIFYSSPYFQGKDSKEVVVGLKDFFSKINNNIKYKDIKYPYTNFFIMNISYFNRRKKLKEALTLIDETNCIFINRWGDLPIWGFLLKYYINPCNYIEDKNLSYFHGSHDASINLSNNSKDEASVELFKYFNCSF